MGRFALQAKPTNTERCSLPIDRCWNAFRHSFAGNKYYIADFQYELLTGAGFTVERKGVASVAQVRFLL